MKNISLKIFPAAVMIAGCLLFSITGNSQDKKLPDGTIVYSDGTKRLPNGTIIYKDGNTRKNGNNNFPSNNGVITLPDGTMVYPDGSRRYPKEGKRGGRKNKGNNGQWLPPGQAKKIYGGSAKDYAPGQQKKWKGKDRDDDDHDNNQNHDNDKRHGKGHKDND
ncbi:MAG: hypothetical protein ACR2KZ_21890 [Segetibacter sp.]